MKRCFFNKHNDDSYEIVLDYVDTTGGVQRLVRLALNERDVNFLIRGMRKEGVIYSDRQRGNYGEKHAVIGGNVSA